MHLRLSSLLLAATLATVPLPSHAAEASSYSRPYAGGGAGSTEMELYHSFVLCSGERVGDLRPAVDIGGACLSNDFPSFPVSGSTVDIHIDDLSGAPVLGHFRVVSSAYVTTEGWFCGHITGIDVAGGVRDLTVMLVADVTEQPICPGAHPPTTGVVTADIY